MKKNMQKSVQTGRYFSDIITPHIIKDISFKLAHTEDVIINFVENDYEDDFFTVPTTREDWLSFFIRTWLITLHFLKM